jgi:Cu/Ag efflux protein CusF
MLKKITVGTAAALVATAALAGAQTKTLPGGELKTLTATVEAIEQSTRSVTVRKSDGTDVTFYVPKSMTRFDQLKVGDKINAKYYDSIVITVQDPKSAPVDTAAAKLVPVEGAPAGTMSYQRVITATITAIDPKVPSITFTGPNNWTYSSRVEDKAALSKVKVGDKVTITWTAAVLMSVEGS